MKKKIVTLMTFVMLMATITFAHGTDVSKNVLSAFSSVFVKATDVKWEKTNTYYKAVFLMNGQLLNAFLSEQGEIIVVSRNILSTELPINLQVSLNKDFLNYWIADLVEYAGNDETTYYVTVENADEKITLKSIGTYDWSLFKMASK